jgi:prepilin-type processing-associated H-X9-DG protein
MVCPSSGGFNPGWSYAMSEMLSVYEQKLNGHRGLPMASVSTPARVLMLSEAPIVREWGQASIHIDVRPACWGGPLGNGVDVKGYEDVDGIPQSRTGGCYALPRYRHSSGAIIAWADGHVSWRRKGSLRWCRDVNTAEPAADCRQ